MCDIAPLQMKCEKEEYKDELFSCAVCHVCQAFNDMWLEIPVIRHFIEPYRCPNFENKRSDIHDQR